MFNSRDVGKAVARNDVGMSILTTPSLSRIEPNLNVFDLPMLNGLSIEERNALVDGPLGDALSEMVGDKMGVVVPGDWFLLGRVLYWSTNTPLNSLDDFNGLQVRIPGGAANVARIEKRAGHIRVDFVLHMFPTKGQRAAEFLSLIFALVVGVFFVYAGILVVQDAIKWDERTDSTLRIPFWYYYLTLSVSFTIHAIFILDRIIGLLRGDPLPTEQDLAD